MTREFYENLTNISLIKGLGKPKFRPGFIVEGSRCPREKKWERRRRLVCRRILETNMEMLEIKEEDRESYKITDRRN